MRATARSPAALFLLLALPVGAFLAGRPAPLPKADLTFVLPQENATFDPHQARSFADGMVLQALFEGLTRLDPVTVEPRAAAAETFTQSDGGRVHTFTLRQDAAWSDGRPLEAADFVYAWRRAVDPATPSQNAQLFACIAGAEDALAGRSSPAALGVEARDPRTLVVALSRPCAYFPALAAHFAFAPLRRDVIERHGASWTRPGRLVSNGPFRLELRRLRDRVRLVRNEHWHGAEHVALRVVDALAVDATSTALNLYLTGAADWLNVVPQAAIPALRGRPDLRVFPVFGTNLLRFNVARAPLDDERVRRAIDLAIDRAALCAFVYRGGEAPARSFVPPALGGYEPALREQDADVARARDLLRDAGFAGGAGLPEMELLFAAQESARAVAEALAAGLEQSIGVRLRPVPQEFKVYLDSQSSAKYDVCLASWVGDYADPTTFLDVFRGDSASNRTGWRNAAYDALLDRAAATTEPAGRFALLRKAEALLLEHGPMAPIAHRSAVNLVAPRIDGFTDNALDWHPLERLAVRATPEDARR